MITDLPLVSYKDGVFPSYVLEKHHQDDFEKHACCHTSTPLSLVHNDLCGPLPSTFLFWFKYFLNFIDEFSRRTWVYFLKLKSEFFDMFLSYKALVEI
jgi:hypothetical protein